MYYIGQCVPSLVFACMLLCVYVCVCVCVHGVYVYVCVHSKF